MVATSAPGAEAAGGCRRSRARCHPPPTVRLRGAIPGPTAPRAEEGSTDRREVDPRDDNGADPDRFAVDRLRRRTVGPRQPGKRSSLDIDCLPAHGSGVAMAPAPAAGLEVAAGAAHYPRGCRPGSAAGVRKPERLIIGRNIGWGSVVKTGSSVADAVAGRWGAEGSGVRCWPRRRPSAASAVPVAVVVAELGGGGTARRAGGGREKGPPRVVRGRAGSKVEAEAGTGLSLGERRTSNAWRWRSRAHAVIWNICSVSEVESHLRGRSGGRVASSARLTDALAAGFSANWNDAVNHVFFRKKRKLLPSERSR